MITLNPAQAILTAKKEFEDRLDFDSGRYLFLMMGNESAMDYFQTLFEEERPDDWDKETPALEEDLKSFAVRVYELLKWPIIISSARSQAVELMLDKQTKEGFFEYLVESFHGGQLSQARDMFKSLPSKERLEFIGFIHSEEDMGFMAYLLAREVAANDL